MMPTGITMRFSSKPSKPPPSFLSATFSTPPKRSNPSLPNGNASLRSPQKLTEATMARVADDDDGGAPMIRTVMIGCNRTCTSRGLDELWR